MQLISKFSLLAAFALAPVIGQAQLTQSSISGSANMWTSFAGSDFNLSYDRGNPQNFFSVGITAVVFRSRIEHPDTTFFPIELEGPTGQLRYGVFAEYGIFPVAADTARFRPYFSVILGTRVYDVEPARNAANPVLNVWEKELNIGYGLRVQIIDRLALYGRFGFALMHSNFYYRGQLLYPDGNKFNTLFDFRVGTTYYLTR